MQVFDFNTVTESPRRRVRECIHIDCPTAVKIPSLSPPTPKVLQYTYGDNLLPTNCLNNVPIRMCMDRTGKEESRAASRKRKSILHGSLVYTEFTDLEARARDAARCAAIRNIMVKSKYHGQRYCLRRGREGVHSTFLRCRWLTGVRTLLARGALLVV
mmetsp:Transcript_24626/g.51763  ORF Transcript_24626/g.51763 Transcript_24626/m.51763 type:complete len:158 (-) Transcript_24626:1-474(-)